MTTPDTEPSDIAVHAQDEIQIFANQAGGVSIKAVRLGVGDEDAVITIRPEHVDAVIEALIRARKDAIR